MGKVDPSTKISFSVLLPCSGQLSPQTSFHTVLFHSRLGYKIFLNINPNSQGTRKCRCFAVLVNITAGENDNEFEWPYDGKVCIRLLNQLYDEGHYKLYLQKRLSLEH